jgi:hypothetical protein
MNELTLDNTGANWSREGSMVFGHNTNLNVGSIIYHVQTEDRGAGHALIDTTVYFHGRVLHRRTNNYYDLLPLNEDHEQALKLRVDEQHRTVVDEIRNGILQLAIPRVEESPVVKDQTLKPPEQARPAAPEPNIPTETAPDVAPEAGRPTEIRVKGPTPEPRKVLVELLNVKSWLNGKHATLQISVKEQNGKPVAGAMVSAEIEGSAEERAYRGETGSHGQTQIEFEMPRITGSEAALVIQAEENHGKGHLRFALRAKPRVPSV